MKIFTWNVNGLRTFVNYDPWYTLKSYDKIFDRLEADVLCVQELKTPRRELTKAMGCPRGYDGFFNFPASQKGYSGVATYTRHSTLVPFRAEEGLAGTTINPPTNFLNPPLAPHEQIGAYPSSHSPLCSDRPQHDQDDDAEEEGDEGGSDKGEDGTTEDSSRRGLSSEELRALDLEGRCVVVDVGLFVLINVYCPNETNDERLPYKMNFLRTLEARVRGLIKAGREVMLVGDMNVVHKPMDHGEGSLASKQDGFWNHPARRWFDALLHPSPTGILTDVVREAHPDREMMYTCWNTKIDARASNYGTRLDYILVSSGLLPWIKSANILPDIKGSDHCPVFVELHDSIPNPALQPTTTASSSLPATIAVDSSSSSTTLPTSSTSTTHPAVLPPPDMLYLHHYLSSHPESSLGRKESLPPDEHGERRASLPPRAAACFYPEFSTKSIASFFRKKSEGPAPSSSSSDLKNTPSSSSASRDSAPSSSSNQTQPSSTSSATAEATSIDLTRSGSSSPEILESLNPNATASSSSRLFSVSASNPSNTRLSRSTKGKERSASVSSTSSASARKKTPTGQLKLSSFFAPPPPPLPPSKPKTKRKSMTAEDATPAKRTKKPSTSPPSLPSSSTHTIPSSSHQSWNEPPDTSSDHQLALELSAAQQPQSQPSSSSSSSAAAAASLWSALLPSKPHPPPRCTVHDAPCIERTVAKPGANKGKHFWLCSLPHGPGHDSQGRANGRLREEVNREYKCDFFMWASEAAKLERKKGGK